jgi:IS30 family transposase
VGKNEYICALSPEYKKYDSYYRSTKYEISALKKVGCTQAEIAKTIRVLQSSISRELQRNKTDRGSYAHAAQKGHGLNPLKLLSGVQK